MTFDEVVELWNNQADKYNQWDSLSSVEQVEWSLACCSCNDVQDTSKTVSAYDCYGTFLGAKFVNVGAVSEQTLKTILRIIKIEETLTSITESSMRDCSGCKAIDEIDL